METIVEKVAEELFVTYSVEPFTLLPGTFHLVLIESQVNGSTNSILSTSKLIEIEIIKQPLFTTILGGNRLSGYMDVLTLKGDAFDPNVEGNDAAKREGITKVWTCKNVFTNEDCVNRQNQTINMAAFTDLTVTIPAG